MTTARDAVDDERRSRRRRAIESSAIDARKRARADVTRRRRTVGGLWADCEGWRE
jgi:hypothetical protein